MATTVNNRIVKYILILFNLSYRLIAEAATLSFNGSQHMVVIFPQELRSQTEDIALRFRTTRPMGLLLVTSTDQAADKLHLVISAGRVKLNIRIGDKEKVKRVQ